METQFNLDCYAGVNPEQSKEVLIQVFCGLSIERECRCKHELHPLNQVKEAKKWIDRNSSIILHSNSTDFISTIKYYGIQKGVKTEFFLDGVSHGDNIDPIFEDLNKSIDLLDELCPNVIE